MADENIANAPSIDIFKDDMFVWILDPNSSPQTNSFLLSKFIQERRITFAVDVGAANAYEIVLKSTLTAYVQGQEFTFLASAANTGATTLKVDALGTLPVLRRDGTPLQAGDIPIGSMNTVQFDGTDFQLMSSDNGISAANLQNSDNTFDVDTGAADAYVITLSPAITAYAKGQLFSFEAINANLTTTPTVDVNGQGAQTIINRDGSALQAGDIPANSNSIIQYDGTNFQLMTSIAWVRSLTTGTGDAVQNTVTSDVTAQTGTNTFSLFDSTIDVTGRTSTGDVNFLDFKKTDTGTNSVFKVDIDGNITATLGTFFIFGTGRIDNRSGTLAHFSHEDATGNLDYAVRQNTNGFTVLNSKAGQPLNLSINSVPQWAIDSSGNQTGATGNTFTVDATLFANDRIALGLTTGDVASPLEGQIWYNNTTNKFRANENGVVVNMIGGGGDVTKVGTPVNNEVGVWTGDGTLEGESQLTFNSTNGLRVLNASNASIAGLTPNGGIQIINQGVSASAPTIISSFTATRGTNDDETDGFGAISDFVIEGTASRTFRIESIWETESTSILRTSFRMFNGSSFQNMISFTNDDKLAFYDGTTPVVQPSAYTRNATIVEDKTLLASASATTINNNNVLAALINDLQLLGLVG